MTNRMTPIEVQIPILCVFPYSSITGVKSLRFCHLHYIRIKLPDKSEAGEILARSYGFKFLSLRMVIIISKSKSSSQISVKLLRLLEKRVVTDFGDIFREI